LRVKVKLFGGLEKILNNVSVGETLEVELPDGNTVKDLLERIGIPEKESHTLLVNGLHAELDTVLQPSDRVSIFPPVGGG